MPSGALRVVDHQDMTVDLYVSGTFTSILSDLILNGYLLPSSQGVSFNYHLATLPTFGFDLNNSWVSGFDLGKFA
jgi:hypothetical protein